jgi:CxxC motif-containing protein (DUF1111 family)
MTGRRSAVLLSVGAFMALAGDAYRAPAEERPAAEYHSARPGAGDATASATDFGQLGQPRADLTPAELSAFYAGKKLFTEKLPKLGPLYNAQTCAECHSIPTVGGGGDEQHAGFIAPDPVTKDVQPYHTYALPGWKVPTRPPNVTHRIPPPLYGLGLIERIPDETIRAACARGQGHADPAKNQGSLPRNTIARFGAKPFVGTLPDFVDSALFSESQVTSPIEKFKDDDAFPDPEVDREFVETLAAFVRGLQPPGRNGTDAAGEAAFRALGCATCHVPDMPPANNVFSDFCVHRMGDALADGIFDHQAKSDEFRTTPLQGFRFKKLYLHDGRATTPEAAISAHAGEAQSAARAYQDASSEQRAALLRFLQTL